MSLEKRIGRKQFIARAGRGASGLLLGGLAMDTLSGQANTPLPFRLSPVETLKTGIGGVRGMAFSPEGSLFAVGSSGLQVLGAEADFTTGDLGTGSLTGVDVDDEGFVYLAQETRVVKLDPSGRQTAAWGTRGADRGEFGYLTGMSVSGGMIYLADAGNRRVSRFAIDGDYVDEIEGFHIPSAYFDCHVDHKGLLHLGHTAEHRIEKYDGNGELVSSWGEYGSAPEQFCGCCNPTNIALLPKGNIATSEKGIPRVKVYDPSGALLAYLGPEELGLHKDGMYLNRLRANADDPLSCHDGWPGMPMAADAKGRLAVALPENAEVRLFELVEAV